MADSKPQLKGLGERGERETPGYEPFERGERETTGYEPFETNPSGQQVTSPSRHGQAMVPEAGSGGERYLAHKKQPLSKTPQ